MEAMEPMAGALNDLRLCKFIKYVQHMWLLPREKSDVFHFPMQALMLRVFLLYLMAAALPPQAPTLREYIGST